MSALFDLDTELAAGAETVKGPIDDLVAPGRGLDKALETSRTGAKPKIAAQIRRAMSMIDAGKPEAGARLLFKVVAAEPELAVANHAMGIALERLGRLSRALQFYERALERDPKNPELYQNLGHVAVKLGLLPTAEKFMRLHLQLAPHTASGAMNLAAVLRDQAKFADAIEILRQAIYAEPENADLWNALGTAVMESGEAEQAVTFHEEVLRLRPGYSRGHHNLAGVLTLLDDTEGALAHYEAALAHALSGRETVISRHALSNAQLAAGRLEAGWESYLARLDTHYDSATIYLMDGPRWDGADASELEGKTILIVGEQGIGDEILFANVIADAIKAVGPEGEVRLACEARLVSLFQRSFPTVKVDRHYTIEREGRQHRHAPTLWNRDEVDLWLPMGNLCRAFRSSLDSFPDRAGFLVPDPARVAHWRDALAGMGDGPKLGVLWKSLKMDAKRAKHFSPFEMWKPVLKTPGVTLVNLQYGETQDELDAARERFGVTIHQPENIDLKADLDDIASLSAACDLVIGPMNATTNIAAAAGAGVWFIRPCLTSWTMLGAREMAWYPQTRTFAGARYRDWTGAMKSVAAALADHVGARAEDAA